MSSQTIFVKKASTNYTVYVDLIQDNSGTNPGDPLTGLVYNSTGLVCYYVRPLAAAAALTLATQTVTGAHSDGGFVEVDATNMPGTYRLDLSDAILATGVDNVVIKLAGYADLAPHTINVVLTSVDLFDSVRMGLTALPNAAADAAGGLPISDAGALDLDTKFSYLTAATATATALATAQADLDIITDTDGVVLGAAGVDLIWDEVVTGHTTNNTTGKILKGIQEGWISAEASVNDASATTTSFITDLTSAVDNFYNDAVWVFITGALKGQSRPIISYNGTTKAVTFDEAFTSAPADTDQGIILNGHTHPVTEIVAAIVGDAVIAELTTQGDTNEAKLDTLTTTVGTAGAGLTDLGGMSTGMKAEVNAEADTALADYDAPTNAEMEARTPTAAQLVYITRHAATAKPVTFSGTGTTTTATLALVDGATPSAVDDQYKSRVLIFNAGTLDEVVTDITAYNGTTKIATVTAVPVAITSAHTAVMV